MWRPEALKQYTSAHDAKQTLVCGKNGMMVCICRYQIGKDGKETELEMTSAINLWNWSKAAVCSEFYADYDIYSCHPYLLWDICKHQELPCAALIAYNQNRIQIMEETGLCVLCCQAWHPL